MKVLNMSEGKKFKLPKLKIDFWQEGADKKVAGYRALIIFMGFLILVLIGQVYGASIKSGELVTWGKEDEGNISEDVNTQEQVREVEEVQLQEGSTSGSEEIKQEDKKVESVIVDDRTDFNQIEKIYEFTQAYAGSRIDSEFFQEIKRQCKSDPDLIRTVIAISVSESGMGKGLPSRQSNFWGWFKGGSTHYDPTKGEMAFEICNGIDKYYRGIGENMNLVVRYTGNSKPTSWLNNYRWAWNQMEVK